MTKAQVNAVIPQILTSLEKANYIVSGPEDIAALTAAALIGEQVPATYLRVLIANTQLRSGMEAPRVSTLRGKPPVVEDMKADLELMNTVHGEFYAQVLRTIVQRDPDIADEKGLRRSEAKRRALERNKRSNKFRQAKSVLAKYIKAGGNFRTLCVCSVSRPQLRSFVLQARKESKEVTPQDEAKRHSARVVRIVESLREESEALAQLTVQDVIGQLSNMFDLKTTSSSRKAIEEGSLLKTADGIFWPVTHEAHMTQ